MTARTAGLAIGLAAWLAGSVGHAQNTQAGSTAAAGSGSTLNAAAEAARPTGPAPRLPDGTPDLSGVWVGGGPVGDISDGLMPGEELVLLPEAEALMKSRMAADDPEARCLPTGVPRVAPYPWRIVQTPAYGKATHLFFLFEGNIHSYRQIFMDGRAHPDNLEPTWYGHSVGHWEDDTLVIETVGFNELFWFDFRGHPHTKQLKTIERYTRIDEARSRTSRRSSIPARTQSRSRSSSRRHCGPAGSSWNTSATRTTRTSSTSAAPRASSLRPGLPESPTAKLQTLETY
jgi:hypothetical protein